MSNKRHIALLRSAALVALLYCSAAHAQSNVEAFVGAPFGVGKISMRAEPPEGESFLPLDDDRFALAERNGRVLYPAKHLMPVRRIIRQFLSIEGAGQVTIFFLFQGAEPLELTLYTPQAHRVTVRPRHDPRQHRRLLDDWWKQYAGNVRRVDRTGDYPLVVENYLTSMLSRRLNLPLPRYLAPERERDQLSEALGTLLGTESIRLAMQKETILGLATFSGEANIPMPKPLDAPPVAVPEFDDAVDIEAIAAHVPEECYYIRFGDFNNYLWLTDFLQKWGGDLRNMINNRGIDYGIRPKIEQQIALKQSALAKILGPSVISDVAMIGNDFFMREGASFGILFEAKNNFALTSDITGQRQAMLDKHDDARMEDLKFAGRNVSFLRTPDNRVRSFYAVDGNYHLVTTSKTLVQRFFEAADGNRTLAATRDFQHARRMAPLRSDYTIFAYLSDAFFRNFAGPHYRIEMTRRTLAAAEMEMLTLARLAARAEGRDAHSADELIAAGLLPRGFGVRPDGSRLVMKDGRLYDSLRGARGTFLPVSDVVFEHVTRNEYTAYQSFAAQYMAQWRTMDPIVAAIKRVPLNDQGLERVFIDAHLTPYDPSHYSPIIDFAGIPTRRAMAPVEGDVVSLQIRTSGRGLLGLPGTGRGNHLFLGIRDFRPPLVVRNGWVHPGNQQFEIIRAYFGAWPRPGLLGWLFGTDVPAPDDPGVHPARTLGVSGFLRRWDDFMLFSFNPEVMAEVAPQIRVIESDTPAQVRLNIADLSHSHLKHAANAFGYMRARQTSASGARLMNSLTHQLHVPPDETKPLAEQLLGANLQCALGGTYTLVEFPSGYEAWTSTSLHEQNQFILNMVPEGYEFPLLTWFRGLSSGITVGEHALTTHVEIDMQLDPAEEGGFTLPDFPTFGLGGKKEKKPEPLPPPKKE